MYNVTVGRPLSLVSVFPQLPIIIKPNQRVNLTLWVYSSSWHSYEGPLSVTVYVRNVSTTTAVTQTYTVTTTLTHVSTIINYGPPSVLPTSS